MAGLTASFLSLYSFRVQIIVSSFKQALKNAPLILKDFNKYFGFYFIAGGILTLIAFNHFFPNSEFRSLVISWLVSFSGVFTIFIIPYCAFNQEFGKTQPFWTFVGENVWPMVWNYIKAFFIILLFCLLLIVPGIYKMIRYIFLAETVFFDRLYKQNSLSALKAADRTTRGFFWLALLFIILFFVLHFLVTALLEGALFFLPELALIKSLVLFVVSFYLSCFLLLLKVQFYFALKEKRGEALSQ